MAVTISIEANATNVTQTTAQVSANLSAAFKGIQDQLKAVESASTSTTAKMVTGLQSLSQQAIKQTAVQGNLSKSFLQTGQAAQTQLNQFEKLRQQYTKTEQSTDLLNRSVSGLSKTLSAIGVSIGIAGLVQLTKSIIDAGLQMERFERILTAASGSSKAGADAFRFITAESNRLGQSIETMVPIFVQLTAATRNTALEGERTRELFSALAGAGQAVGLSTEAVGGAMVGLTQIISQNAIQLDEFRNQFASRIPGAMLETAKALKTLGVTQTGTIAEMLKGFERGRIGVADLTKAVTMGLQEIQRTAPSMANSASLAFTQLSNAAFQLKADLARSGLLEFLAQMADSARSLLARIREALGLAGGGFLREVADLQGKLSTLRQTRQELLEEAPRSNLESTLRLEGLLGTTQAERLKKLNDEIALQEGLLQAKMKTHQVEKDADVEKARIDQARRDKEASDLKAADAAAASVRQGAQDAAARARAQTGLAQERVNQEKIALDQIQALRAQALESDYSAAVENTEQTKAAQAQVETAFAIRRLDLTKQAALEDAAIQERAVVQVRDAKIAAIKAADAAAQATATAPGATAEAQINANKRSAASTIEMQTANLAAQNAMQEATKKRTEAEAAYEKGVSAVVRGERADQIKIIEEQLQRESQMRQQALQGQASILSAETELVQAQVDGLVLTREEGLVQTQALERDALEVRRSLLEDQFQEELRQLENRVAANKATEAEITALRTRHTQDIQVMNLQEQTQAQEHRTQLLQGWIDWVKDVQSALGNFLFRWMDGQVTSIKDVLLDLKSYFFRIIAEMVAKAAVSAIVIPIVTAVVGGAGGGASGLLGGLGQMLGLGGTSGGGGGLMDLLGLAGAGNQLASMFGVTSPLSSAVGSLTKMIWGAINGFDAMLAGQDALTAAMESAALGDVTGGALGGAEGLAGLSPTLGAIGGIAAIVTGIYGALKATNAASKAAFAASAAAGTAALASTALVAAGVIAASSGWTGIGLIAAAVTAIIGTITQMFIKPAGPSLSVRAGAGLNIGTADGQLQVQGDLGSQVTRREGVDRGVAQQVQQRLEEGITAAVSGIVQTINAVALDPAALVGPTQEALQKALRNLQPINTANAKKMEKDIAEQLRFANIAIIGGLLEPVNLAFDQLRDQGDLTEQLDRLPGTTAGLVAVFKTMNEQLDEIAKSENTDVLRQISGVRNQVENFGNRIAGTAGQIAENIVTGLIKSFSTKVDTNLAGQITQFSGLMTSSIRALGLLRSTRDILQQVGLGGGAIEGQIDLLAKATSEMAGRVSKEIVSTALAGLSADLDQVLIQPIAVQATTVNALFSDSVAALAALQIAWTQLSATGLDTKKIQEQFSRLLGGMLEGAFTVIRQSFTGGSFAEFLGVLLSIPEALTALNPTLQAVQNLGKAFASVVAPIEQVISAQENDLRTTEERVSFTAQRMTDLRQAIADAGDSAEQALPLYARLSETIQANAAAQIEAINEQAQAATDLANDVAESQRADVQKVVDVWTDEVNALADSQRQQVQEIVDIWTDGVNALADAQREALQASVDVWTDLVNEWADAQTAALQRWVDDTTAMVNDWADSANAIASQVSRINDILLGEMSPAQQQATLQAQKAALQPVIAAGGPNASAAITRLIEIDQQLLGIAKQGDNLKAQKDLLDELATMRDVLTNTLVEMTGQSDPFLAQLAIADTSKTLLSYIAAYQKAMTEYITGTQQTGLNNLQIYQKSQLDYIQTVQDSRLQDISAWEKAQLTYIATAQDQRLENIATYEAAQLEWIQNTQDQRLQDIRNWQEETVNAIKRDVVHQLQLVQYELQKLFAIQYKALTGVDLPTPAPPTAARGGLIGLASGQYYAHGGVVPDPAQRFTRGGLINAMLEPGERVFSPRTQAQQGALLSMNQAFPRFAGGGMLVPGSGSGDTVPAFLRSGTVVLNRRASAVVGALGMQGGGSVPASSGPPVVNIHIATLNVRNDQDIKAIISGITAQLRREWRSPNDKGPFR